jgi:hypothetical protein
MHLARAAGRLKELRRVKGDMMAVHSIFKLVHLQRQGVDNDAAQSNELVRMESLETNVKDIAANPRSFSLAPTAPPNIMSFDRTLGS